MYNHCFYEMYKILSHTFIAPPREEGMCGFGSSYIFSMNLEYIFVSELLMNHDSVHENVCT